MKNLKVWFSGLSSQQQMFAVLAVIVAAYFIYKSVKGTIQGAGGAVQNKSTLTVLSAAGIKPSYENSDYELWADRLDYAMWGTGTYEQIIYNVYSYMKNDADITKLNQAFGIRYDYDLSEWLMDELTDTERAKINKMLKDKGISKIIK